MHTGIWKHSVDGPRMVRRLNIDGDGQGDLGGHGGEQRAVFVYQIQSYEYWQSHFGRDDFEYGQFGENFTVDGLADDEVCVGDRYRIGAAEFEVTQPRVTCFRVGLRMGEPQMAELLVAHHRPGFYLRVITEGQVQAGDEIVRTRIGPHAISVADVDALLYLPDRNEQQLRAAVDIAALEPGLATVLSRTARCRDRWRAGRRSPAPGWAGFRSLRVDRLVPESATITSVYLSSADGQPLPPARPGQYLTLRVAGAGDPAPVRSYSLSSGPDAATYRISVKREARGLVSGYLNSRLRPEALLDVAAPRGEFVLADEANPVLLVSAGVGITPVLAMLHQLADGASAREVWWIHTARDRDQDAFADEAHQLLQSLQHAHEHLFYTAPMTDPPGNIRTGRPTAAILAELGVPADATAYLCGPSGFMTDLTTMLTGLGVAADHVHTELFGALAAINPGLTDTRAVRPHQPPGPPGTGPEITFARSGLTVPWSASFPSLLDLADSCDVPTRYSCRTGVCHTCVTPLLSGDISYAPAPLELPAPASVLICCAQPVGDEVVLDL